MENVSRKEIGRRRFLRSTSAAALGLAATSTWKGIVRAAAAPSERVRIGCIGVGNKGTDNLKKLINSVVAVCEVDQRRLEAAKKRVHDSGNACDGIADYRRLLDRKDIDAVVVTTPDHWHALQTIHACQAGKDVYCEKPLTLFVSEGQAMVDAARKHGRIVQTGSQQRSDGRFRLACELVRSGRIGKLHTIECGLSKVNFKPPAVADSAPPPELDYDMWLGPAPKRPYNEKRVHYLFRFFWDYSGGQQTNWGAHHLDIAQWGMEMDQSGPVSIEGRAKYEPTGMYETPMWSKVVYKYASGVTLHCGFDYVGGTLFVGDQGKILVTRKEIVATPREILDRPLSADDVHLYSSSNHFEDWLQCIKSRKPPICDVAIGHRSASVCHLGNIALRTGRKIQWDPAKQEIVGDAEAAKMLTRPYRGPWQA